MQNTCHCFCWSSGLLLGSFDANLLNAESAWWMVVYTVYGDKLIKYKRTVFVNVFWEQKSIIIGTNSQIHHFFKNQVTIFVILNLRTVQLTFTYNK